MEEGYTHGSSLEVATGEQRQKKASELPLLHWSTWGPGYSQVLKAHFGLGSLPESRVAGGTELQVLSIKSTSSPDCEHLPTPF